VLGAKEAEAQSASLRSRAKGDEGVHKVDDLVVRFQQEVATRALPEKKKP
jgi:threonyl-tRNA synthetase